MISNIPTTPNRSKQLLVVADEQTVAFFSLIGAKGFIVAVNSNEYQSQLQKAIQHVREKSRSIGGILVAAQVADVFLDKMSRIKTLEVPIVRLPAGDGTSQLSFLETLMEKAVGMKLQSKKI